MKKLFHAAICATVLLSASAAAADSGYCGPLSAGHYGPYDYRMRGSVNLDVVERAHFTREVEAGIRGSTGYLGQDLNYTLRAIPNHPRALSTLSQIAVRKKTLKIEHMMYPVECYFDRALRFVPDDGVVKVIYGGYLHSVGRSNEALKMLQAAVELLPQDPTANYNLGLVYFARKDYSAAMRHARVAYDLGFPLPGLKNKLAGVGKWEQEAATATAVE